MYVVCARPGRVWVSSIILSINKGEATADFYNEYVSYASYVSVAILAQAHVRLSLKEQTFALFFPNSVFSTEGF